MKKINLLLSLIIGFTAFSYAQNIEDISTPQTNFVDGAGGSFRGSVNSFELSNDSATLIFSYLGDLDLVQEIVELFSEDSVKIGQSLPTTGQCLATPESVTFRVPADTINKWMTDSVIEFIFDPDPSVGNFCAAEWCQVRVIYPRIPVPDDATTQAITEPDVICAGMQNVVAEIANFGLNQIDSVDVNWEINGVAQPTHSLVALLDTVGGAFPHDTLLDLGAATFVAGTNTIKVFTSNPNAMSDTINDNDTIFITLQTALAPANVQRFNFTTTSVDVDMDNVLNQVVYEYGLDGFIQGTGTLDSSNTLPFTISGLTAGTDYDLYVRNNCGSGDTSLWVGPLSFLTSFGTPYFQDFEAFPAGTSGNPWPEGWKSTATDPNFVRWEAEDATGFNENDANTGPLFDHTLFGQSGGDYIYFENGWFDLGEEATFISPPVEIPDSATSLEMSFWYFNFGTAVNRMEVYIDTNGTEDLVLTLAGQQQTAQTDDWREALLFLNGYEGSSIVMKFRGYAHGSAREGDMAIDDVSVKEIPRENAAVTELIEPGGALCPGTVDPVVAVQNAGVNDLTSVDVVSDINGTLDTTSFTFAAISTGDTVHLTLPSVTFASGTTYDLAFYPLMPNGLVDGDSLDDTLSFAGLTTGLSGNVTLDPSLAASATNYISFDALSNQVNSVGICGLVTVTVANGTYTDNLRLIDVPGTSPTDRLIIDGKGRDSVRLRRGAFSPDATVFFENTSYVTIKNMTIENRNTGGEEWGVHFSRASHHDSILNVYFDMGTGTFDVFGVGASAQITDDFSEGDNANHVTVMNCTIDGGAWGIKFEGPSAGNWNVGNSFINNHIINWDDGGIQTDQQDTLRVIGNTIELPRNNFADGMNHFEPMNFRINQNYVFSNDLTVQLFNANSAKFPDIDAQFINNMVISLSDDGVNMTNPSRIRILHNSVWSEGTAGPAINLNGFTIIDSLDCRNNAFSSESQLALDMAGGIDTDVFLKLDNNVYYTSTGTNLLDINGTTYADLASYQVVQPVFNVASLEGNPLWETDSNLTSIGTLLNDAGDNSANILVDINGDPRPIAGATFVDIGAVEYDPPPCSAPSGLTVDVIDYDTANFSWISTVAGSTVEYEYVISGNAQTAGPYDTTSADTVFVGGLTENTDYDLYIREICRRGDTSGWIGPVLFTTPCMPSSAPFSENFDVGQTNFTVPECWAEYKTYDLAGVQAGAKIDNFNSFSAPNNLEINSWFGYTAGTDSLYSISPRIPDLATGNIEVSFQTRTIDVINNLFVGTTNGQGGAVVNILDTIFYNTNNVYQLAQVDITTANGYNGTDEYLVFMHSLGGTFDDIRIDDLDVDTIPSCRAPRDLRAFNAGPDSVELDWTDLNGATSWQIEYDLNTLTLGSGIDTVVSTNPFTLKGLTDNSTYQAAVRAICAVGDTSAWTPIVTFETTCLSFTTRYFRDFENQTIAAPPECWIEYNSWGDPNGSAQVETVNPAFSGTRALVLDSWNVPFGGTDSLLSISPRFSDMVDSTMQIEFWANTTDIINSLVVATADRQGPNATFTALDTISWNATNVWTKHVVTLDTSNGYNGTDQYIVFSHTLGGTFDQIRIDDFEYDTIPSCPEPGSPLARDIGSDSAELVWTNPSGSTTWQLELGVAGFLDGNGEVDSVISSNPFIIDSLDPNTDYEFRVRSICAVGDTSEWTGRGSFKTLCAPFTAAYFTDFDAELNNTVPGCWGQVIDYPPGGQAGAIIENFNSFSAPNHLEINSWFGFTQANDTLAAITPHFLDMDSNNRRLRFMTRQNDVINDLHVYTSDLPNGSGTWTSIDTIRYLNANVWFEAVVDITTANGYNGTDQYIILEHSLDGTFDEIGIDDFHYEEIPTCLRVTSPTSTIISGDSMEIAWTDPNGASLWEIEYGLLNFNQGFGTTKLATSNPDTLTGLTPGTKYNYYIRALCDTTSGSEDSSFWVGPFLFETLCDPEGPGWFEDFEGVTFDSAAPCWFNFASYGLPQAFPRVRNAFPGPIAGTRSLYLDSWNVVVGSSSANFVITPELDSMTNSNMRINFSTETSDIQNSLYVGTADMQSTLPVITWLDSFSYPSANVIYNRTVNIDSANGYLGAHKYVIFAHSLDATFDQIVIDDVEYVEIPSCQRPQNISVASLTPDSVEVSWTEIQSATEWEIEYGETGFVQGTGTSKITTSKPDTIGGLMSGTRYDLYLRSICTVGDSSIWEGPIAFKTDCEPVQPGYFTDFESDLLDSLPNCWTSIISYGEPQSTPRVENIFPGPIFGNQSAFLSSWFGFTIGVDQNALITPQLDSATNGNTRVRFWALTEDIQSGIHIGTAPNPNPTNAQIDWIDSVTFANAGVGTEIEIISNLTTSNGYNGTDEYVVIAHDLGATFDEIAIDDFNYEEIPSCFRPDSLMAGNFRGDTAQLSWLDTSSATQWEIEYGAIGFVQGTGTSVIVNNDTADITGLVSATRYDWYLRAICGAGDSSLFRQGTFEFCSGGVQPGYFTDFENDALNEVPICWTANITYGLPQAQPRVQNTAIGFPDPIFGDQAFYLSSWFGFTAGTDENSVHTPQLVGATAGDKRIRFHALTEDISSRLLIGTCNLPGDTVDWHDTIIFAAAGNGNEVEIIANLDSANGYNHRYEYVVLAHDLGSTFDAIIIDDFHYENIPTCFRVTDLGSENEDTSSVDLDWTDPQSATQWQIEYDTSGFTLGTGNRVIANSNPYTLTGLAHSTFYDFYVRAICSAGDTSFWSTVDNFNTLPPACTQIVPVTLPYVENWENDNGTIQGIGVVKCDTNAGWAFISNHPDGRIQFGTDAAVASNGNGAALLDIDPAGPFAVNALIVTLDMTKYVGATDLSLTFDARDHGDEVHAGDAISIRGSENDDWILALDMGPILSPVFGRFSVDIDRVLSQNNQTVSSTFQIRFGQEDNFPEPTDGITYDSIRVDGTLPSCIQPTALTTLDLALDSATVAWTELDTATSWEIQLDTTGFTLGSGGTIMVVTNDSLLGLGGLDTAATYDFYVRAICAVGDSSLWSGPLTFTTLDTIPCQVAYNLDTSNVTTNSATLSWADSIGAPLYQVTYDTANFVIGTGNMVQTSLLTTNVTGLTDDTDYDFYVRTVCGLSDTSAWSAAFSFKTDTVIPCLAPTGLDTANVTTSTADLSWVESNPTPSTQWEVEYGLTGFTQGTGTSAVTTSNPHGVSGLTDDTDYDFYVRSICGPGDTSIWSSAFTFRTDTIIPCLAPTGLDTANVTTSTADFLWTETNPTPATEWEVEYGLTGFAQGTGTSAVTTSNPHGVSGLTDDTDYDFYVRSICGPGDSSVWSSSFTFRTDSIIPCLEPTNLDTNNVAITSASVRWTENNTTPATEWLVEWDTCGFALGTGNTAVSTSSTNFNITGLTAGTCYDFYVSSICGPGDTSIASVAGRFTTDTVVVIPCRAPINLQHDTVNIGADSVLLSWTELNTATEWEVEYGLSGFSAGTGTKVIANTNINFEIDGLTPMTLYDFYVRSICSAGDTSIVSDTASFNTGTVGIEENQISLSDGLSVYPNPSNGLFTLTINLSGQEKLTVILRDVRGKLIEAEEVTVNGTYRSDLDYTGLAKGVYYLQVQSEDESTIKKLVIQ